MPKRSPLLQLTLARVRSFVREPAVLFWVFAFPALLALGLGLAFRDRPPEPARVGLPSEHAVAPALVHALSDNPAAIALTRASDAVLSDQLRHGALDLIVIPTANPPSFTYRFDPQRAEARLARAEVDALLQRALGRSDVATLRDVTELPRGSRYIDFLLPSLIAMNLLSSALWGVGYGMVQERSKKLMRRFATTPLSPANFLASYILSRLIFLAAEVGFLVAFGSLAFDVTIQGSLLLFFAVSLLGVLTFTGFAVLAAARTSSVEVVSGYINVITLPMWLLSGTFFSYERFPEALHPIIQALPLTALNDALRAITNEGASLAGILPEVAVLVAWGALTFVLGVRLFRWR